MSYNWIYSPLCYVDHGDYKDSPMDEQHTLIPDDLNNAAVHIKAFDIPEQDRRMYADLSEWSEADFEEERRKCEDGEETFDYDVIYGFFVSGDADLDDPQPQDVFVAFAGPDYSDPGVYLPVGQHSSGSYQRGDYLISIEDYEAISGGIYTPAVYTCDVVREWDPHKMLRPKGE